MENRIVALFLLTRSQFPSFASVRWKLVERWRPPIWKSDRQSAVRYNVTFEGPYKDDDDCQSTDSFGRDDLLVLAKVVDQAHSLLFEQGQEETQQSGKCSGR